MNNLVDYFEINIVESELCELVRFKEKDFNSLNDFFIKRIIVLERQHVI
jgi:hypothetical protein